MIVDLPDTTVSAVSKRMVSLREEGGAVALGRVLTLVIVTSDAGLEAAIDAANAASREHPMRVIVLSGGDPDAAPRLDAQIRLGGDAGASEVIVLAADGEAGVDPESLVTGLLLPDAPVVAWWPSTAPLRVADTPLGRMATRRITDVRSQGGPDGVERLVANSAAGDTDFAWSRITLWRAQLAAVLDQPPYLPVEHVEVTGASDSPSVVLLAAWLGLQLGCPVELVTPHIAADGYGIDAVQLDRADGPIRLQRISPALGRLSQPGQPVHDVALPLRTDRACLAEELRRLDPDVVYERVLTEALGLPRTVEA